MNYIVLDLEWNQCPTGKSGEIRRLPFEIIEIGAVKLEKNLRMSDSFREDPCSRSYIARYILRRGNRRFTADRSSKGRIFLKSFSDFLGWCGADPSFCTWGPSDLMELQRNLAYHQLPIRFRSRFCIMISRKFSASVYEDRRTRRSLEFAVDFLKIPKDVAFHSGFNDAHYTSVIMQHLTRREIAEFFGRLFPYAG